MMERGVGVLLTAAKDGKQGGTPQFVTDTITLMNDGTTWLLLVSVAAAVAVGVFFIIKWYTASENEKPAAAKRIKGVVIGAVGVVIFEVVLKLVLSYYTH